MTSKGQMRLGAFFNPTGHHVASWRHPRAQADAGINFAHYLEITRTAERGKFDMIFLADNLGVRAAQAARLWKFEPATLDGKNPDGWFPEQRLTVEEALRAYTQGSAYAAFQEKDKGTLAPGKLGDVVVLSDDLFTIPLAQIKDARVVMTIVGGKIVYSADK